MNNAIAFAQIDLRGGMRGAATATGLTFLAALVLYVLFTNEPQGRSNVAAGYLPILLGVQGVVLMLVGGSSVVAAIRFDLSSRLIESHRLMPTRPVSAVIGYIVGPTLNAVCVSAAIFIAGALVCVADGTSPTNWAFANLRLFAFSFTTYCFLAYFSFLVRSAFGMTAIFLSVIAVFGAEGFKTLPVLSPLLLPLLGHDVQRITTAPTVSDTVTQSSVFLQATISAIFISAAARRYGREGQGGFSTPLAMLLVLALAGSTAVGLAYQPLFLNVARSNVDVDHVAVRTVTASMVILLLVSHIPVVAACREAAEDRTARHYRAGRASAWRALASPWFIAPVTTVLISLLPLVLNYVPDEAESQANWWLPPAVGTGAVVLLSLLSAAAVLKSAHRFLRGRLSTAAGVVAVVWIAPLVVDFLRVAIASGGVEEISFKRPSLLVTASPGGAIAWLWHDGTWDSVGGVVATTAAGCAFMLILWQTIKTLSRRLSTIPRRRPAG